jgi:uncharacterized protein (DUF2252 family)
MPTVYDRIIAFNKNRLPDMVKLKYRAMSLNVFSFYRGTCHLFYEDLAAAAPLPPSPTVWACGDLHVENFGSFKGDDHQEYFDLNDFDEALLAPAAWEIVRMATSIFIAFDSLGLDQQEAIKVVRLFLDNYSNKLKNGKAKSIDPRTAKGIVDTFLKTVEKRKLKEILKKCAIWEKGKFSQLIINDRHFKIEPSLKKELMDFIDNTIKNSCYAELGYITQDCVFRLAGTGSVGVNRYLFLLRSTVKRNKYLLLDMKQASPSSLQPYVKIKQPGWASNAERVIAIQERMQNISPALLTPVIFKNAPYVIKQMQPTQDKINLGLIKDRYDDFGTVIHDMAVLTASAQLRSSGRQGSAIADELITYGQNYQQTGAQDAIVKYALQYTKRVKKDYKEFIAGYDKGLY